MCSVPFGSIIVPKGHFRLEEEFGTKSFFRKTFYNSRVRDNFKMAFIWYANCSIHFTGQEAKEKMSLRVDDKPNLFIISFQ